jgi:hypothetical protein
MFELRVFEVRVSNKILAKKKSCLHAAFLFLYDINSTETK